MNPTEDISQVCMQVGTGPNQPEQILTDYYVSNRNTNQPVLVTGFSISVCQEEDLKNQMNADRRCAYLEKKIQETEDEIARQEKAKQVCTHSHITHSHITHSHITYHTLTYHTLSYITHSHITHSHISHTHISHTLIYHTLTYHSCTRPGSGESSEGV